MAKRPKSSKSKASAADEADLFRAVMTDAVPLDAETRQRFAPNSADLAADSTKDSEVDASVAKVKRPIVRKQSPRTSPLLEPPVKKPAQPGDKFDRVTLRQVKQGKMAVEGRLDLHGLTQTQAHSRLGSFIEGSARAGKRCVLIITGKGAGEGPARPGGPTGRGILRQMTPQWLSGPDLAPYIVDFQSSLPRDGGTGAIYVRLRRPK